ncbi:MAG: sugar phosphate isomerase/epimerase [Planctomycetes bacterium]|nr:sugar phosphate isomerase/epimerase [Planctomycetota bacterium]
MYLNLAPSAVSVSADLKQTIALAKKHGFAGIDLPLGDPLVQADPAGAAALVRDAGLRWGAFGLPVDFRGEETVYCRGFDALYKAMPLAQKAGCTRCTTWIMPAHNTLEYKDNLKVHVDRLARAAKLMAEHGIRFGIEPVAPFTLRRKFTHPFVHNIDTGLELADAIGSNTGLLLDAFHWHCARNTAGDIRAKLTGRVVLVHVNDARPGRTPEEQIDNERALPTETGVIDLKGFIAALRDIAYDGPVTAEPFMRELGDIPADAAVGRVAATMQKMMAL